MPYSDKSYGSNSTRLSVAWVLYLSSFLTFYLYFCIVVAVIVIIPSVPQLVSLSILVCPLVSVNFEKSMVLFISLP